MPDPTRNLAQTRFRIVDLRHKQGGQVQIYSDLDHVANVLAKGPSPMQDARLFAASAPMLRQLEYIADELQYILDTGGARTPMLAEEIGVYLRTTRRVIAEAKGEAEP